MADSAVHGISHLWMSFDDSLSPSPVGFFCVRPEEVLLSKATSRVHGYIPFTLLGGTVLLCSEL